MSEDNEPTEKEKGLPEIPVTWIICFLILGLVVLRGFGIDTFVTAGLMAIIGYITGRHIEQLNY